MLQGAAAATGAFQNPPQAPLAQMESLSDAAELPAADSAFQALLKGRQALASGEVAMAEDWAAAARQFPVDSSTASDTPAKLEGMIARHRQLAEMRDSGDQHLYHHGAAAFLLDQAEALMGYRDVATAEQLILMAKRFPVDYQAGDRTPDQLLAQLGQFRNATPPAAMPPMTASKADANKLLSQAQLAFDQHRYDEAQRLVDQVKQMNLDDSVFNGSVILPWDLELKIVQARTQSEMIAQTAFQAPPDAGVVKQADYYPELDTTTNEKAGVELPNDREDADQFKLADVRGKQMYDSGVAALKNNDTQGAMEYFRMAWQHKDQLDDSVQQDLQAKMTELQVQTAAANYQDREQVTGVDEELRRKMFSDVLRQRAVAERMLEQRNPRGAMNHLRKLRDQVQQSELDAAGKQQLSVVIEREISEMERYIENNLSEIETDEMNAARKMGVEMDRQRRDDIERKIQQLVQDFNKLMDEQRFAEADVIARQANALDPDNQAVVLMLEKARLQGNAETYEAISMEKRMAWEDRMLRMEREMIADRDVDDPIGFDKQRWDLLNRYRKKPGIGGYASEEERVVWSALKNQNITVAFNQTPLSEVIAVLAERAGVNMIFDTRALELANVSQDQPITMDLSHPISIESALDLILGNQRLVFLVENQVVKITDKDSLQSEQVPVTYYVGDLVVPVPHYGNPMNMEFLTPSNPSRPWATNPVNGGLVGMDPTLGGGNLGGGITPVSQQMPNGPFGNGFGFNPAWSNSGEPQTSEPMYNRMGPQDVSGGITAADFDELINLIQETIDPDSWEENGGSGRMQPFPATLSLIVTQTQENQDRIQNLLSRLRELNDVQIVVEVRFVTLRDDFFERIGVDFDFRIEDGADFTATTLPDRTNTTGGSAVIGREAIAEGLLPTVDLDIPFTQNSFGSAVPQFGGFDPATAANFGFAILSDIEVFFLLQAAKGDQRSNVVQAPTVTMFNGQSASVFDGSQQPFVTSIMPIVGDFAAAQQPIISILPEGTQLNVRAVVSSDRRFVKMTLVPFFSEIQSVSTFQFAGERSVRRGSSTTLNDILDALDGNIDNDDGLGNNELEITEAGTTVQLPVFANTTITTTVSVPDGGTVLLGGIKRMSEGRTERGLPFLSNIPYVNRLFKNVGIGRETSSLMMMVTPRIIIQEEEEQFQVGSPGN